MIEAKSMQLVCETERLILKVLNSMDAFQVLAFLSNNRQLFEQYEGEKNEYFYTMDYIRDMLTAEYNQIIKGGSLRYYIYLKSNPNRIIGTVSLTGFRWAPYDSCNIGYKFDGDFHHYGYAFESIWFLLSNIVPQYRLHRITAYIAPDNLASIRLIGKLGFCYEGTARGYVKIHGKWTDHRQYSLLFNKE